MGTMTKRLTMDTHWSNGAEHRDGFVCHDCITCGVVWAMTETYDSRRLADGKNFHCPNGHQQHYTKNDTTRLADERAKNKQLREQAERREADLLRQVNGALDDAQHQRRTAAALKGHLTRARNRAAAGICPKPGCKRSFDKLADHVRTEHPDLIETLPE